MIFFVDNYDSFTYNLVQAFGKLDPDVVVARNDRFDPREVVRRRPRAVVISPGPGRPEDAGRSIEMIAAAEDPDEAFREAGVEWVSLGPQRVGEQDLEAQARVVLNELAAR